MLLTFVDLNYFTLKKQHCQTHPNFSTGNSQGIVWVCINDLSGSGFRG